MNAFSKRWRYPSLFIIVCILFAQSSLIGCSTAGSNTDKAWWDGSSLTPAKYSLERTSRYLTMRDGVRIAADIYLPRERTGSERFPTILTQTRYHRSTKLSFPFTLIAATEPAIVRRFVERGYAWVAIDVRGTGASFGSNPYPWSPAEYQDGGEVVDWIVAQPWSDGKVGATGVSYDGTAAEFLLAISNPALKAIAPRFSLYDAYTDIAFPGGIHNSWFTRSWAEGNIALDSNELPAGVPLLSRLAAAGVRPVDEDPDGGLLEQAIAEHQHNPDIHHEASALVCRDDRTPSGFTTAEISPFSFATSATKLNVPIYSISGWWDGAYANAAIKRFLSVPTFESRLLLGPWNHGGRRQISSAAPNTTVAFDQIGELLRFFDFTLKGLRNGIENEPPVHYFTMGAEEWRSADSWPPESETLTLYPRDANKLLWEFPMDDLAFDRYQVRQDVGSGRGSRWRSVYNIDATPTRYVGRAELCSKLLCYTSPKLPQDVEVTGHAIVSIFLSSSAQDGIVIAYLDDVPPDGEPSYVTEGELRVAHRAISDDEPPYNQLVPYRSFERKDATLLPIGTVAELRFDLLPTSYLFKKGHRIRLLIAGADSDLFQHLPKDAPQLTIYRDRSRLTRVELPVVTR